ncbi:CRISPR-associated protein Csb3 [Bifidobacterium simiarum]|uniref:CRISPR-associated protein Csb3 n=1 Tax=Bifidobacterium simiarum TaxID=2045441 RepID=UPI001BDCF318|nr:CRISPR-associated protein Csb3 [Bifidobacterium simiarum]MBT1165780.1 CRISPR-associated protein Csb3 [Bifidobacterium simiarum]
MDLEVNGRYDDAFTHLLLVGLASILEDDDEHRTCLIWWKNRGTAVIRPSDDLSWEDCAAIVQNHAKRWADSSWLNASGEYSDEKKKYATLSPRFKAPSSPDKWRLLEQDRAHTIDTLQTALDYRQIGALGEPSYWSGRSGKSKMGASRWDMTPRNGGQEFVGGRLRDLSKVVSGRDISQIINGLLGKTITDEIDVQKKQPGKETKKFTANGLRSPSITDNAQAWCALFGISAFPVMKSTTSNFGSTAAFAQIGSQNNPFVVLPIWLNPWTIDRYRAVVRSRALLTIGLEGAFGVSPSDDDRKRSGILPAEVAHSRRWLKNKSVEYCMLFQQYEEMVKAPNVWLMKGHPVFLEDRRMMGRIS